MEPSSQPLYILPVGTQVVLREALLDGLGQVLRPRDAVAVVIHAPMDDNHLYRVRFPDGGEAALRRGQLAVRKEAQQAGLEPEQAPHTWDWNSFVIYRCVVGSRAYGLAGEGSDTDRRGIYLPPADIHWSLYGVPEQLESKETEETYWELQKFLTLALKANPNILECLYTPLVEWASPLAEELLAMRASFLSKLVYQSYSGYVMSQFKKMERSRRTTGTVKPKHAMHLIRLLLAGITILREGVVPVDVGPHRERLLAIRHETLSWEDVNAWRLRLHQEFDLALQQTRLPERPDYAQADAFLLRARRSMVSP